LRLGNERRNILLRSVCINCVVHLDAVKAVTHVLVDAEDTLQVHARLDGRFDRPQLYVAILRDGGDTRGQAACQTDEDELDRRGAVILGREKFRVVGIELEGFAVLLRSRSAPCGHPIRLVR
jgi:hypothetical protein